MSILCGPAAPQPALTLAEQLNAHCACRCLDAHRLHEQLEHDPSLAGLSYEIATTRPNIFSNTMVFVSPRQVRAIEDTIAAIETLVALPRWRDKVLADAPRIARDAFGPRGVFMGYDFHLGEDEPRLIEINTNAGGAYLAAILTRSQIACCAGVEPLMQSPVTAQTLEDQWITMFREEWRLQRGDAPLRRIVIVDEEPQTQFLHPEFLLFQRLFQRAGWQAEIADPSALRWQNGRLWLDGAPVDFVYNRLTDFYFATDRAAALGAAYAAGAVVVTPNPHAHALHADKRHLERFGDDDLLRGCGLDAQERAVLARHVPHTREVAAADADRLWLERRKLFFKPAAGYGGRAAYRGDKITRRVWSEILAGNYVAQRFAPPGERRVRHADTSNMLKFDVRAYAYDGQVQLFAARLYSGQTTNFRTPGGGFAPVFVTPE